MTAKRSPMQSISHVHFVGIGGAGMCGIAEVLANLGYRVSGSDLGSSATTERLSTLGIDVKLGHDQRHIGGASVIVYSSAVPQDNPELKAARAQRIPIVSRAEMLGELMRFSHGIAVGGTHGKTTTTSMVANVLAQGRLDPTFVIGGKVNNFGSNAKLGSGAHFVSEADESDASFLYLKAINVILTNIDHDHLETYHGDFSILKNTFLSFIHNIPFYGRVYICLDDEHNRSIMAEIARPMTTYGFNDGADVRALNFCQNGLRSEFDVQFKDETFPVSLHVPGKHNVRNALAAIALARDLGVSVTDIQAAFANFKGVGRRFECHGIKALNKTTFTMVEDYGHHPEEIANTIETIRAVWPEKKLVMVFQPHRYTRTRDLYQEFVQVLSGVDKLILLDVYSAGETAIPGFDSKQLAAQIQQDSGTDAMYLNDMAGLYDMLSQTLEANDTLLMQGAGDISNATAQLDSRLDNNEVVNGN